MLYAKTEAASAELPVTLTIIGQARLSVSGEGGRLSGEAYAGQNSQLTVVLRNDGTEAARDVELSATAPKAGNRHSIRRACRNSPAAGTQQVKITLTPSEQRDRRRLPDDDPRQCGRRALRNRQISASPC